MFYKFPFLQKSDDEKCNFGKFLVRFARKAEKRNVSFLMMLLKLKQIEIALVGDWEETVNSLSLNGINLENLK